MWSDGLRIGVAVQVVWLIVIELFIPFEKIDLILCEDVGCYLNDVWNGALGLVAVLLKDTEPFGRGNEGEKKEDDALDHDD